MECTIGDAPMIGLLADRLGVSIAEAVGLHALVWAKVPEHARDGNMGAIPRGTVERWVSWTGKRGAFADAYYAVCADAEGYLLDWERVNGAAMRESEATSARVRGLRAKRKSDPVPPANEVPAPLRTVTRTVRRTPPVTHASNGNGTTTEPKSGTAGSPTVRSEGERRPHPDVDNLPQPAAASAAGTATARVPSAVVTRFMARFYSGATPERRADIAKQTTKAILNTGVQFRGSTVRAVDAEHLDDMCLEVMEDPPREANAAWVFVLTKLRDTYLEVLSARAKAVAPPRAKLPDGMTGDAPAGATPIRAALAGVLDGLTEEADA